MSRLPEHLSYYEDYEGPDDPAEGGGDWYPRVICEIPGCGWHQACDWSDLGDDTLNWATEHPLHDPIDVEALERRQAAVDAAEAGADPLTPEQMGASIVDALRELGATDAHLYASGLIDRFSYLDLRGQAAHDEVRFRVNALADVPHSQLAQRCAWFERMTRTDPTAPPADVHSARYQRGNALVQDLLRAQTGAVVELDEKQWAAISEPRHSRRRR